LLLEQEKLIARNAGIKGNKVKEFFKKTKDAIGSILQPKPAKT